jgi:excinuclease ABC subunit B
MAYNREHGIIPKTIHKSISNGLLDLIGSEASLAEPAPIRQIQEEAKSIAPDQIPLLIAELEEEMKTAARMLEFEKAAQLRDQMNALKAFIEGALKQTDGNGKSASKAAKPGKKPAKSGKK